MSDITLSKAVRSNLLHLQNTARLMDVTQERLATGKKVNSALDNPTNFFTSEALNSRAADISTLLDAMSNGIQTIEAADNGLSSITKTIESMQSSLRQARQDNSFQTGTYDVTADSVLRIAGGQFGDITPFTIALDPPNEGKRAALTSNATTPYTGPVAAGTLGAGAGASIAYNATMDGTTDITVDGYAINLTGITGQADVTTAIQTQLDTASPGTYEVLTDGTNIVIQTTQTGSTAVPPVVNLGASAATSGSVSFQFDADRFGQTLEVDGTPITVPADIDTFVEELQEELGTDYTVVADASGEVKITSNIPGSANTPVLGGSMFAATPSVTTFDVDTSGASTFELAGQTINVTAAMTDGDLQTAVEGALTAAGVAADYNVSVTGGEVTIAAVTSGSATLPVEITDDANGLISNLSSAPGLDAISTTTQTGDDGTSVQTSPAETDDINLAYGSQTIALKIGAGTEEEIAADINGQLIAAGIGVTASFEGGRLTFTSDEPESKTLAISGPDVAAVMGTETVDVGENDNPPLNSSKAVDQFVEKINRDYPGQLRAINDNGRLRIENISTQELSVGIDKDGTGYFSPHEIAGNNVRANLAKQFNVMRTEIDNFSADASFNGVNLLRGDTLKIVFNELGTSMIEIQARNSNGDPRPITSATLNFEFVDPVDLDSNEAIDEMLNKLQLSLNEVRAQASDLGSTLSIVQNRENFTKEMINTLQTGAANLTLADTNEESANMLALQTRQQLSQTALSLASQADQAVLRLFG